MSSRLVELNRSLGVALCRRSGGLAAESGWPRLERQTIRYKRLGRSKTVFLPWQLPKFDSVAVVPRTQSSSESRGMGSHRLPGLLYTVAEEHGRLHLRRRRAVIPASTRHLHSHNTRTASRQVCRQKRTTGLVSGQCLSDGLYAHRLGGRRYGQPRQRRLRTGLPQRAVYRRSRIPMLSRAGASNYRRRYASSIAAPICHVVQR